MARGTDLQHGQHGPPELPRPAGLGRRDPRSAIGNCFEPFGFGNGAIGPCPAKNPFISERRPGAQVPPGEREPVQFVKPQLSTATSAEWYLTLMRGRLGGA